MNSKTALALLLAGSTLLTACGPSAAEQEAERNEAALEAQAQADAAAAAAAAEPAADVLGMTEDQALDADLVDADGNELGEIELVERNAMRTVTGLVVELDGTDPDRFVSVPLKNLTARQNGDDTDIESRLSAGQLAALPDAEFEPMGDTMSGAGGM